MNFFKTILVLSALVTFNANSSEFKITDDVETNETFTTAVATWSENEPIPLGGRPNPFALPAGEFEKAKAQGQIHAQVFPVEVTGSLAPYGPFKTALEDEAASPFRNWLKNIFKNMVGFESTDDVFKWLGLHKYPAAQDSGIYQVAHPGVALPGDRMGVGFIERNGAQGFMFSCAACHSGTLFGKTVLGMTNRFPRANEFFVLAKQGMNFLSPEFFQFALHTTNAEKELFIQLKNELRSVGAKKPVVLGLDTALAQVALSLNHRNPDADATKNTKLEKNPVKDWLDTNPADSKPAVWWNVKFKNRWFSDGSIVSGNPIYTNILSNEIGKGADLVKLKDWFRDNQQKVRDLTTAVFSSEAPRWSDFFSEDTINIQKARHGEQLFNNTCSRCHGTYQKAWNNVTGTPAWPESIRTVKVSYPSLTQVIDVGTDPLRWQGMKSLVSLNRLTIFQQAGSVVKPQKGYVPPPLVGIWARWPYFHNNSAPTLCSVLTKASARPISFYMGEAENPETDFDRACNGYPLGLNTPKAWRTAEFQFDTRRKGLGNSGHDEGIFLKNGQEIFTATDKMDIIEFLKTL
ncbi:MAG: hypothetical protein V4736_06825 [Bdellovibrionota bacterium]